MISTCTCSAADRRALLPRSQEYQYSAAAGGKRFSSTGASSSQFPLLTRKDRAGVKLIKRVTDAGAAGSESEHHSSPAAVTAAAGTAAAAAKDSLPQQMAAIKAAAVSGVSAAASAVSSAAAAAAAGAKKVAEGAEAAALSRDGELSQAGSSARRGGGSSAGRGSGAYTPAASTIEMAEVVASLQPEGFAAAVADSSDYSNTALSSEQPAAEQAAVVPSTAVAATASAASESAVAVAGPARLRYPVWWHAPFWSGTGYSSEANNFVLSLIR
jgi:hypothetical protein